MKWWQTFLAKKIFWGFSEFVISYEAREEERERTFLLKQEKQHFFRYYRDLLFGINFFRSIRSGDRKILFCIKK